MSKCVLAKKIAGEVKIYFGRTFYIGGNGFKLVEHQYLICHDPLGLYIRYRIRWLRIAVDFCICLDNLNVLADRERGRDNRILVMSGMDLAR